MAKLSALTAGGFDALSLANNHTGDYYDTGLVDTMEILFNHHIDYFGAGHYLQEAHVPVILSGNGIRIALLGYNAVLPRAFEATETSPGCAWISDDTIYEDIITAKTLADFVVIMPHQGEENCIGVPYSVAAQYRRWLAAGADAVMASHPHVLQGYERYTTESSRNENGGVIFYSLGNFIFDMSREMNMETAIVTLTFSISSNGSRYIDYAIDPAYYDYRTAQVYEAHGELSNKILKSISNRCRQIPPPEIP